MPTSLNFFAINNVHHEILGFAINPVSFQALNPFWVVVASPVLAAVYTRLGSKGKDLTMPMKFTLGMFLCALGFLTAAAAGMWFADAQGLTSPWFIVLVYLFQSLGELLISALGLAMVAALVPQHLMGFILGMWFLTGPPPSCSAVMWRPSLPYRKTSPIRYRRCQFIPASLAKLVW